MALTEILFRSLVQHVGMTGTRSMWQQAENKQFQYAVDVDDSRSGLLQHDAAELQPFLTRTALLMFWAYELSISTEHVRHCTSATIKCLLSEGPDLCTLKDVTQVLPTDLEAVRPALSTVVGMHTCITLVSCCDLEAHPQACFDRRSF